jgi:regulator of RNase E activity RraB
VGFRDLFRRKPDAASYTTPAEGDRLVIGELRRAGADLSRPREVLHYLYLPTEDAAKQARDTLRSEGYTAEVRPAADAETGVPNQWLALARIETVVDEAMIDRARERLELLAVEHGGEYDGWEAAAD